MGISVDEEEIEFVWLIEGKGVCRNRGFGFEVGFVELVGREFVEVFGWE